MDILRNWLGAQNSSCYELFVMKTISKDQFTEFMSEALPELMASIMRGDDSAVATGQVSMPQFWALHYIGAAGKLTVNELAAALQRGKSTTSALLGRLSDAGLIRRRHGTADRRVVYISLTPKGAALIGQLVENRKNGIRKTYGILTGTERAKYKAMIEKVVQHSRQLAAIALVLAGGIFSASAQEAATSYSLDESIRIGLKRSLVVANAAREREIAKAVKKRAMAGAYPKLTGLADYSLYDADSLTDSGSSRVGAEASWLVFSGGRTVSAIRASKAFQQLTADQERRIQATQVRNISFAYHKVQLSQAQVGVLEQSVRQLKDFEGDTRKKYDAGTASEFDWLSAKVALSNEEPRLIAAKNQLSLAKIAFRNLTFIDDTEFELSDPLEYTPVEVNLDQALALGLQRRPELMEKASAITLRKEDINQQKSDYYPRVNLFAGYNYHNPDPYNFIPGSTSDGWQDHWSAGVRASWNLFDGGRRHANVSESKLNMAIEEDEYADLRRSVELEIRTHWLRGRDSAEIINATDESIGLAERALTIARARFDAGLSTNLEVTQSNLELSDARLAQFFALYEYMNAVAGMKHAVGILLEEYIDE